MATPLQVEQYRDQGYFIVDDAVSKDMLAALEAGARRARGGKGALRCGGGYG